MSYMMTVERIKIAQKGLTRAIDEHRMLIEQMGESARDTIIKPLCKRGDLKFWSGNGDYWFEATVKDTEDGRTYFRKVRIGTKEDAIEARLEYLVDAFALLDTEVAHNQPFGYYVDSVLE